MPKDNKSTASLDDYLTTLQVERQLSEHTLKAYRRDLKWFLKFCANKNVELWQGLNHHLVQQFSAQLNAQGLSAKSIQRMLSAGRGFCNFLILKKQLTKNPFDDVRAPKGQRKLPKTLTVDQICALVEIDTNDPLSYRDKAILELFYSSGLRLSELTNLQLNDLNLSEQIVRVTGKGKKTRDVPVGKYAITALKAWLLERNKLPLKDFESVFVSNRGTAITPRTIQLRVKFWAKKQGIEIPVNPHMLRHSFASHLLESSGELRAVQELLGHANISTTQIYTHLDFQHLAQVYDDAHPRARSNKK